MITVPLMQVQVLPIQRRCDSLPDPSEAELPTARLKRVTGQGQMTENQISRNLLMGSSYGETEV
jgi:hypothetical protein